MRYLAVILTTTFRVYPIYREESKLIDNYEFEMIWS